MAFVAFLKGINVGGHRRLRPSVLARELKRFDVVSIGTAGTLVVRKAITRASLCDEIMSRVPFKVNVMTCSGSEILRLVSDNPFHGHAGGREIVSFVGVMAMSRQSLSTFPLTLPADGEWCLKVLKCQDRFVVGLYRRQMKAITYLGQLEEIFRTPLTIRSWNTILAVRKTLQE